MHVQQMRTLLNDRDQKEVLDRLSKVRPDSQRRWVSMSAHQMICHLRVNDRFHDQLPCSVQNRYRYGFFVNIHSDILRVGP